MSRIHVQFIGFEPPYPVIHGGSWNAYSAGEISEERMRELIIGARIQRALARVNSRQLKGTAIENENPNG